MGGLDVGYNNGKESNLVSNAFSVLMGTPQKGQTLGKKPGTPKGVTVRGKAYFPKARKGPGRLVLKEWASNTNPRLQADNLGPDGLVRRKGQAGKVTRWAED